MKKRVLGLVLGAAAAGLATVTLASCGNTGVAKSDSKVFHIYAWNEEFKGFF